MFTTYKTATAIPALFDNYENRNGLFENTQDDDSLCNFVIVTLIKIIQRNLTDLQDLYCHNICLAILSNLSKSTLNISIYASQRLAL